MRIGAPDKFYFDFLIYLKANNYLKNKDVLIYPFNNFIDLNIALKSGLIDFALTNSSLIFEKNNEMEGIAFVKNAFKIFGAQNSLDALQKKEYTLKVALPNKSDLFKKFFFDFYNFYYGKNEKIQWLQIDDDEIDILLEQGVLDYIIVFEPLTFNIISKKTAVIYPFKNKIEIPLIFAYESEKKENESYLSFIESIEYLNAKIIENDLINKFIDENKKKYAYIKNYSGIFAQNFVISKGKRFTLINQKLQQLNTIIERKNNNYDFLNPKSLDLIKKDLNKMIMYAIGMNSSYNSSLLSEFYLLKELIDNLRNENKILSLKIKALKNKNKILAYDLENRQQNLSDLFMQFRQTSENLLIKNIQVQESIKEKDRLIAIMSHDLKTPLSGIMAITEQLLMKEQDEEKKRKLSIMLESGNTLLQLINNLLENAKNQTISKKLDEKIFDLHKLIDSISENIKEKIKNKEVEFILHLDKSIPKVLIGDSLKLKQIIYNLLGNSVKFTYNGYIELNIELIEINEDNCKLSIEVKDTGIGISEEKIEHIFDPFVQEDETIKNKYGGTGLGLSIVKDFVELMGGNISCKSKKNKGTSFIIFLNFKIADTVDKEKEIEEIKEHIVFNESSILILEDNLINQEIIKGYLSNYDTLSLVFKENGQQGLEELKNNKYDLIMSDIMMPVMDGKEFCKKFRNLDSHTPLIALTAFDREEDILELRNLGFNEIMSKPYKKDELIKSIIKFIPVQEIVDDEKKLIRLGEKAKNSERINRFKKLFLQDLFNRYKELKEGINNRDKEKLHFFSHNLKGIAPTLGFPEFAELAEKASSLYKNDKWDELAILKKEFLNMVDELQKKL